jgi:hypothetical protein
MPNLVAGASNVNTDKAGPAGAVVRAVASAVPPGDLAGCARTDTMSY